LKWTFELDNGGACGAFVKLIGEKGREFIFKRDGGGGFKFRGEGAPTKFTADARALFAIPSNLRPKIFIHVEVPEVDRLVKALADQEEELTKANATIVALQAKIPAEPQGAADLPEAETFTDEAAPTGEPMTPADIGLPVGPAGDDQPAPEPKLTPAQKRARSIAEKKAGTAKPAKRATSPKKSNSKPKGRHKVAAR
jgi:hypothetical protein